MTKALLEKSSRFSVLSERNLSLAEFMGDTLVYVPFGDYIYISIRRVCDALGIDYSTQLKRIKDDELLGRHISIMKSSSDSTVGLSPTVAFDRKERDMSFLERRYARLWLAKINAKRLKKESREKLVDYQQYVVDALERDYQEKMRSEDNRVGITPEIRRMLNVFVKPVGEGFRKWTKTFPEEFYEGLSRLSGIPYKSGRRPVRFAQMTNQIVYDVLLPYMRYQLERKNPKNEAKKRLKKLHQCLTEDVGHPALCEHIKDILVIMNCVDSYNELYNLLKRKFSTKIDQSKIERFPITKPKHVAAVLPGQIAFSFN